jgi:hypothetical protein
MTTVKTPCSNCHGSGRVRYWLFFSRKCSRCHGSGEITTTAYGAGLGKSLLSTYRQTVPSVQPAPPSPPTYGQTPPSVQPDFTKVKLTVTPPVQSPPLIQRWNDPLDPTNPLSRNHPFHPLNPNNPNSILNRNNPANPNSLNNPINPLNPQNIAKRNPNNPASPFYRPPNIHKP